MVKRPTTRFARSFALIIGASLGLACGTQEPKGVELLDARVPTDASEVNSPDASNLADAGVAEDATASADATVSVDAGRADAGQPRDAGATPTDGGAAIDGGPNPTFADPTQPGPLTVMASDFSITVSGTMSTFDLLCRYPITGTPPFPAVVIGHGFQIAAEQYTVTAEHLASFGYVACVSDFPAGLFRPNHVRNAQDLMGSLDALLAANQDSGSPLFGKIDPTRLGLAGHSLGGKAAVLGAVMDPRVRAVVALDPIDTATNCDPSLCPDASDMLPVAKPIAFLGETLDSMPRIANQACAPAADNYQTFYANAAAPSLEVTIEGAAHPSFLDDPGRCLFCRACQTATADHQQVITLVRAVTVSWFQRYLRDIEAYDTYLGGEEATRLWVSTNQATIVSK